MEELIKQIKEYCSLNDDEILLLKQTIRTLYFPKGSIVVEKGKIDDSIYFIQKGVWRAFTERDGEEQTLWFAIPGEAIMSSWGYIKGRPSRFTISSSSDSSALELKKSVVMKLLETSPGIMHWLHNIFTKVLLDNDDLLVDISSPKAEERYLAFLKKKPEIFRNVPLKEIAGL